MKQVLDNIDIIQRKLVGLKDTIKKSNLTPGQIRFLHEYLKITSEYIEKGLDIIDEVKYREVLLELED